MVRRSEAKKNTCGDAGVGTSSASGSAALKLEINLLNNEWEGLRDRVDAGDFPTTLHERRALQKMGALRRRRQELVAQLVRLLPSPAPPHIPTHPD